MIIILVIILISAIVLELGEDNNVSKSVAKCIGERSTVYVQLGCHWCEKQEKLFGENYKYINSIDCYYEKDPKCLQIQGTPTWVINNQDYPGMKSIQELKTLTNC